MDLIPRADYGFRMDWNHDGTENSDLRYQLSESALRSSYNLSESVPEGL